MISIYPEILRLASSKQFDALAIAVRKYFLASQSTRIRLSMKELLREMGVQFIVDDSIAYLAVCLLAQNRGKVDTTVIVRTDKDGFHLEFLLAHCLGHSLLHMQQELLQGSKSRLGFRESSQPLDSFISQVPKGPPQSLIEKTEYEASLFALNLFLPTAMFLKACEKIKKLEDLASFFSVIPALVDTRKFLLRTLRHEASSRSSELNI